MHKASLNLPANPSLRPLRHSLAAQQVGYAAAEQAELFGMAAAEQAELFGMAAAEQAER